MNKAKKIMMLAACAVLLVCISVGATLAYLTDTEAVTNVFTVGKVGITLDEAKTDEEGNKILEDEKEIRINNTNSGNNGYTNKYHLIPGETYTKDPTVHVDADSESSWIFVKVENGIADIEADGNTTIAKQISTNGWTKLDKVDNVYYMVYTKNQDDKDLEVFTRFTLKGDKLVNGNADEGEVSIDSYGSATVKVTAYAIQMAGFENEPGKAWTAGNWN